MPPKAEYDKHISDIFETAYLTNQGIKLQRLEDELKSYLGANHLQCVANGTLALQLALKALDIEDGEVITTPFSYVATVSAILLQRCTPVFVDIAPGTFMIDADKIEEKITAKTKAILPVHTFGYACDIKKIQDISDRHDLKVIYDCAHAFASRYRGQSLLTYGDIAICSFHATKPFHTIEGGACISNNAAISAKIDVIKRFGHIYDDHYCPGLNAKMSEAHAAMGLAVLPYVDRITLERAELAALYDTLLGGTIQRYSPQEHIAYNYAYYPVLFESEAQLVKVFEALNNENIYPRRYFYPSLNKLPYLHDTPSCPICEDVAIRVACLPLYSSLGKDNVRRIAGFVRENL